MTCPGLNAEELDKLADYLAEKLEWFTHYTEMPEAQHASALVSSLRAVYATHPICQQAANRLERFDQGLQRLRDQMEKLYRVAACHEGGYAISTGALLDLIQEFDKTILPR